MGKITYQDIENTVAECGNMGGITDEIYYAPRSHFKSLASKPSCEDDRVFDGMNMLSEGVDELLPGKTLFKLYETMEKGSLKAERQGEIDGISNKINLTFFTPGLKSKSLAMLMLANQSWIFYVKTGNQMFRVGNNAYAAKMAPDGEAGTGDTTASAKGNTMTFFTYEAGFAGEVVDIAAIENMLIGLSSFSVELDPNHGEYNILVDTPLDINFDDNAYDLISQEELGVNMPADRVFLHKVDIDGVFIENIDYSTTSSSETITITPTQPLEANTSYKYGFDNTVIVCDADKQIFKGKNYAIFVTA